MRKLLFTFLLAAGLILPADRARAQWSQGDPFKMHYPQLPDPGGLDVTFRSPKVLADDWQCSGDGPVNEIDLWFSAQNDAEPAIDALRVSICEDVPQGPGTLYSHPGATLWSRDFAPDELSWSLAGQGDQGWYVPETGLFNLHDHSNYYQLSLGDIAAPFVQTAGQIYWLEISVSTSVELGWKTSISSQFNDAAVWGNFPNPSWEPVYDPRNHGYIAYPLDLAFVIAPEPGSLMLLGLLGLAAYRRR
jgi:hypothetical protein